VFNKGEIAHAAPPYAAAARARSVRAGCDDFATPAEDILDAALSTTKADEVRTAVCLR
jgi:hypothetical protein